MATPAHVQCVALNHLPFPPSGAGAVAAEGRGSAGWPRLPAKGRARRTGARAYPCPAQPRGSSEWQGQGTQGQEPRRLNKPRVAFHFGTGCAPLAGRDLRPRFRTVHTLAPIWLPHCPAWMCTISRMVPFSEGAAVAALFAARSRTRSCGGRAPRCPLNRAPRPAPVGDAPREWRGVGPAPALSPPPARAPRPAPVRERQAAGPSAC